MREAVVSLIITAVMCMGMILRYLPFASEISGKKKMLLFGSYGVCSVLNFCTCLAVMIFSGTDAILGYLVFGGIVYASATVLVEIALIPKRNREHLFAFGVVLVSFTLLQAVPTYICSLLPHITADARDYLWLGIYAALLAVLFPLLKRMLQGTIEPFLHMESDGYWNTICFIPLAYFCAVILIISGASNVDPGFQLVSSLMSGSLIVLLCVSVSREHKRLQNQAAVEKQLEAQKIYYSALQVRVENARKIRHDYKHHLAAVRHFIDMDDKQGLSAYCDEVLGSSIESVPIPYTGNSAADGVLYHYLQQAQRDGIALEYKGTVRSGGIADSDLCALLGNALDNACAGCMTLTDGRHITLISQSEPHLLSLVIRNTFDGNIKAEGDTLMSRKRNNRPGVGVSSMRAICRKYGGNLDLTWDEKTFTTVILLPLEEQPAASQ